MKTTKQIGSVILIVTFLLLASSIQSFGWYETIHDKTYTLELKEENKSIKVEKIKTIAELDKKENKFRFTFQTMNYDKKDWTKEEKRVPIYVRHTNVAPQYMGIVILHPKDVEILASKQKAYHVSEKNGYSWEELIPYEENRNAQIVIGVGQEIIELLLSKIPYAKQGYKELYKYMEKKNKEYYESIFKEDEVYCSTKVPLYTSKKIFGYTETARTIEIPFKLQTSGDKQMSFWINPAFGDPSLRSYSQGTWSTGFGRLKGIVVNFSISSSLLSHENDLKKVTQVWEDRSNIYVKYADGAQSLILKSKGEYNMNPRISQDRNHVIFDSTRFGPFVEFIMDSNGNNIRINKK